MRQVGLAIVAAAIVLAMSLGSAGGASRRANVVVCFNGPIADSFPTPVFRTKPGRCTFTSRTVNKPFGYASVVMAHLRWPTWDHNHHAHGIGKVYFSTAPHPYHAEVFLYRVVDRGGERVFANARFSFPSTGGGGHMALHICTR
jgi:hypothetical protein